MDGNMNLKRWNDAIAYGRTTKLRFGRIAITVLIALIGCLSLTPMYSMAGICEKSVGGGTKNTSPVREITGNPVPAANNDNGNIVFSAPTVISMNAIAAGTLICPSTNALAIRNLSSSTIRVKTMDTQANEPFHLVPNVGRSNGNNDFQMTINGVSAAPAVELADDGTWEMGAAGNADGTNVLPLTISSAKIARVTTNLAQRKKVATITWTITKSGPTAFAIYSADDQSLNFYKRKTVPTAGDTFNGKTVTAVYTGIEEDIYRHNNIPWKNYQSQIKTSTIVDEIAPISTARWFYNCKNINHIDLSKLYTSNVTNMDGMFLACSSLTSLDLSGWNTSNVTDMGGMFTGCSKLTSIGDISMWDVSNVTEMSNMFGACRNFTSFNLANWNTPKLVYMNDMFAGCHSLTSVNLSKWDTSNVNDRNGNMFANCERLQEITLGYKWKWVWTNGYPPVPDSTYIPGADGKWYDTDSNGHATGNGYAPADIPSNRAMTYTAIAPRFGAFAIYSADDRSLNFYKRKGIPTVGDTFNGKMVTAIYEGIEKAFYDVNNKVPWTDYLSDIKTAKVIDEISPVSIAQWFSECQNLISIDLTKLDTSKVTNMTSTFYHCTSLSSLSGLSGWDTSQVTMMMWTFNDCYSLSSVGDLSGWDTSQVTNMRYMFNDCYALSFVGDISGWDTSKVTDMPYMFCSCSKLSVNCSNWNVDQVLDYEYFNLIADGVIAPAWKN